LLTSHVVTEIVIYTQKRERERTTCSFLASVVILLITRLVFQSVLCVTDTSSCRMFGVTTRPFSPCRRLAVRPIRSIPTIAIYLMQTAPVIVCLQVGSVQSSQAQYARTAATLTNLHTHVHYCHHMTKLTCVMC